MKTFKNILVPVDFSACSAEAMRVAAGLSADRDAVVCLLHVSEPISYAIPIAYPVGVIPNALENLDYADAALADAKVEAQAAGISQVTTRRLHGSPANEIVDYAKKNAFDLIVMGTHGHTGIKHALIGSVTEKVVRKAPCPVLTLHAESQPAKPKGIETNVA